MQLSGTGLVLEGGGLRGIFTSGVLRLFMDRGLHFPYVIGVSMGACNGVNYVSRQPERNRIVNTRYVGDSRYLSTLRLLAGGDLFGMDFIFDTLPNELVPFDYGTFYANDVRFIIVATDCVSGEAVYLEKSELGADFLTALRASSSLPFIAKPVEFRGKTLMDGGLSDSIPIRKCLADGNRKAVLVLTRERGYRKKRPGFTRHVSFRYPKLPGLKKAYENRYRAYNEALDEIEARETGGEIFVIRPERPLDVGRAERNKDKLYLVYDYGYDAAKAKFDDLLRYLEG